mgnify:CR=1 FL=1
MISVGPCPQLAGQQGEITFPIVREKDEKVYGRYRTRDLILDYYNAYEAGDWDAWVKG